MEELKEQIAARARAENEKDFAQCKLDEYQVYDIINLNDGTALFYEKSMKLGMARVGRMRLANGEEYFRIEGKVPKEFLNNNALISEELNYEFMRPRC